MSIPQAARFSGNFLLDNVHWLTAPLGDLIVVEGFPSVWWFHQRRMPPTVAVMGSDCSPEQAGLIVSLVKPSGRLWLMPNGDKAGVRFAETALPLLAPHRFVRWAKLEDGRQPTDLGGEELKARFAL